ncbi:hypothetical protein MKX01_012786 [Papaver californicum]|nr:hypothetical protein MKX01_012786 [Papaver californicum]
MEGKNLKMISLMVIVLLGLLAGKSSAFDTECYVQCLIDCSTDGSAASAFKCPFVCLKKCNFEATPNSSNTNYYYNFGCAVSNCIKKSTPQVPRADEVEHCVNSYCDNKGNK